MRFISKVPNSRGRTILKIVIGLLAFQNLCASYCMGHVYSPILTLSDAHDTEIERLQKHL